MEKIDFEIVNKASRVNISKIGDVKILQPATSDCSFITGLVLSGEYERELIFLRRASDSELRLEAFVNDLLFAVVVPNGYVRVVD